MLKPSGSIYLHCDDSADSYLRVVMDAIFGAKNRKNSITWKRTTARSDGKRFGRVSDTILYYSKGNNPTWHKQYGPYDPEYVRKFYRFDDNDGRGPYRKDNLANPSRPWEGGMYQWKGYEHPPNGWRCTQETMQQLHNEGRLSYPVNKDGSPAYTKRISKKRYLSDGKGTVITDLFADIRPVTRGKERTGYPTQKPLALLRRIIRASSNPGDLVLDPFAGCATTCVAAEQLGRQWIGIDISDKAEELVTDRLQQAADDGTFFGFAPDIEVLKKSPRRTDSDAPTRSKNIKAVLYRDQGGVCANDKTCPAGGVKLPTELLEVDHIQPRSKGGQDVDDNLQLLCGHCNRVKGNRAMAYLLGK